VYPLLIVVGAGDKAQRYGYYVEPLACDFGLAFRFTKLAHQVEEGHDSYYDVLLDPRGHHECFCLGHLRHGHRTVCKHVAVAAALVEAGRLPGKPATPAPATLTPSYRCTACHENLVDAEGGEDTCGECLAKA
jgi:hypothetical protein